MKIFLLVSCFIISNSLFATLDYSVNNTLRTLPRGIFSEGRIGKSFKFWHKPSSGKKDILYGYGRVGAKLRTSIFINSAGGIVEIYPISFLGFFGGVDYYSRNSDELHKFDCNQYACEGSLKRGYYGVKLGLKFKNFFIMERLRYEKLTPGITNRKFADEQASILGRAGGDTRRFLASVFGYELSDSYSIALLNIDNEMKYEKSSSSMTLGLLMLKKNKWKYTIGLGAIKSDRIPTSMTSIINIKYTGLKGFALF